MPLDIIVSKEKYVELISFLKNDERTNLNYYIDVTAVDWESHFDVITQLMSIEKGHKFFVRVSLPKDDSIEEEKRATSILAKFLLFAISTLLLNGKNEKFLICSAFILKIIQMNVVFLWIMILKAIL